MQLKPIMEQVVVILGASSGIGRETALRFAKRGAKVVVAARSEAGLESLAQEIRAQGGFALAVPCDVTDLAQVEAVGYAAAKEFGRIDTWVNVAAVSVYARFEDTTPEEFRRVMDVNYMGQVHGALVALPYLRKEGRGALIVVSSVESVMSIPLHSSYSASKHAVEGVFDGLRRELLAEGVPISITSIKPATINTPFFSNARTKMGVEPKGPPPIYQPNVVADCILFAAEHPVRDLFAGGAARAMSLTQVLAPTVIDAAMARIGIPSQKTENPKSRQEPSSVYAPETDDFRREGDFTSEARPFSLYTWFETRPTAQLLLSGALLGAGAALLFNRARRDTMTTVPPATDVVVTETVVVAEVVPEPDLSTANFLEPEDTDITLAAPSQPVLAD